MSIPGDVAVTKEDVAAESACAQLASGRSEVVGLALWLIVQRCKVTVCSPSQVCPCFTCRDTGNADMSNKTSCNFKNCLRQLSVAIPIQSLESFQSLLQGSSSPWKEFVDTLPQTTNSPTLWPPEEQSEYLQGSPALQEAQARSKALDTEWDSVSQQLAADPSQQADCEQSCHSRSSQYASIELNHAVLQRKFRRGSLFQQFAVTVRKTAHSVDDAQVQL